MVMYLPLLFCDDQKVCEEEHMYLDSRQLLPKCQFTFISSPYKMCEFTFPDKPSSTWNDRNCFNLTWKIQLWAENQNFFHAFHPTCIFIAGLYNLQWYQNTVFATKCILKQTREVCVCVCLCACARVRMSTHPERLHISSGFQTL